MRFFNNMISDFDWRSCDLPIQALSEKPVTRTAINIFLMMQMLTFIRFLTLSSSIIQELCFLWLLEVGKIISNEALTLWFPSGNCNLHKIINILFILQLYHQMPRLHAHVIPGSIIHSSCEYLMRTSSQFMHHGLSLRDIFWWYNYVVWLESIHIYWNLL